MKNRILIINKREDTMVQGDPMVQGRIHIDAITAITKQSTIQKSKLNSKPRKIGKKVLKSNETMKSKFNE